MNSYALLRQNIKRQKINLTFQMIGRYSCPTNVCVIHNSQPPFYSAKSHTYQQPQSSSSTTFTDNDNDNDNDNIIIITIFIVIIIASGTCGGPVCLHFGTHLSIHALGIKKILPSSRINDVTISMIVFVPCRSPLPQLLSGSC